MCTGCATRKRVAIKRIAVKESMYIDIVREIHVMASCSHENIVRFLTSFVYKTELWIVMDLLDGGSIRQIIEKRMRDKTDWYLGVFDEREIATVMRETLKGLDYLRKHRYLSILNDSRSFFDRFSTVHSPRYQSRKYHVQN